MAYIDQALTFELDKIYYTAEDLKMEVMMSWEEPIMAASAEYVCSVGGDILEIGFGMGISAGYIQSHSITSHTIVENHPEIIPKAKAWASGKPNVTIITGSWYDIKDSLSTYDGVFYDAYGDDDQLHFGSLLPSLVKPGGVATWWNSNPNETNFFDIPNVTYQQYSVDPPANTYFNNTTYYLPTWQH